MITGFNRLTLQSTINDSAENHSNQNDAESDPKSDQLVATHTSDGKERKMTDTDTTKVNSPHKLLTSREISVIIPVVIPLVKKTTVDGIAVFHKEIVTGATRSASGALKDLLVINWKDASRPIPWDRNKV